MKNLSHSPFSMNTLNGTAGIEVVAASQLSREFNPAGLPVLITQIEKREHLENLMDWLSVQGRLAQVLTLISPINGTAFTQAGSELLILEDRVLPLQAYIADELSSQAIALQPLIATVAQLRNPRGI